MQESNVKPEKITKPIQLLAAWLAGLLSIDSCFLFAATYMPKDSWEMGVLVIAAIVNVPLFLLAVFLLQTRFRPEMQEDSYYSSYLSRKTNETVSITKDDAQFVQLRQMISEIEAKLPVLSSESTSSSGHPISMLAVGINRFLSDKVAIGNKLSEMGVIGYTSFGGRKPPNDRSVAISQFLPSETVKSVIQLAKELGFTHYVMFDNLAEETSEEVLFGNYGTEALEIAGV